MAATLEQIEAEMDAAHGIDRNAACYGTHNVALGCNPTADKLPVWRTLCDECGFGRHVWVES